MSFDDLFDQDRKHHKHGYDNYHGRDHRYDHHDDDFDDYHERSSSHHSDNKMLRLVFDKIQNNPKLKGILFFAIIAVVVVIVIALILLFPLLTKLVNYLTANGIQGIIDAVWKGSK